jgi:hypothetical protein
MVQCGRPLDADRGLGLLVDSHLIRGAVTADSPVVLETKLIPPVLRSGLVTRGELIGRMAEASAPVVLVSAPVGYGKTKLVVPCVAVTERAVAWGSLDAADNDPGLQVVEIGMALDLGSVGRGCSCRFLSDARTRRSPDAAASTTFSAQQVPPVSGAVFKSAVGGHRSKRASRVPRHAAR